MSQFEPKSQRITFYNRNKPNTDNLDTKAYTASEIITRQADGDEENISVFTTDRPCYCNIETLASADRKRAPGKEEFEDYFFSQLSWLGLFDDETTWPTLPSTSNDSQNSTETSSNSNIDDLNIDLPEDCEEILFNQTNFTATVVARVSSDILCATQEELNGLGQVFLFSYNTLNVFNDAICDPNVRFIFSVDVQTDFSFGRRSLYDNAKTQTDYQGHHGSLRHRRQQEVPIAHSPAPLELISTTLSQAPSTSDEFSNTEGQDGEDTFVDVLFTITGTCSDCEQGINLLELEDDVIDRKLRRDERTLQTSLLVPVNASCACNQDSAERAPTAEELLAVLQSFIDQLTFVTEIVDLVEVNSTVCSDQWETFQTTETVSVSLEETFGLGTVVTKQELEQAFVCTYNWLATRRFCNPAYAYVSTASYIEEVTQVNSFYIFDVQMRCRNCTGIFDGENLMPSAFQDDDRRRLKRSLQLSGLDGRIVQDGQCFCPLNAPQRAPTRSEFEDAFGGCLYPPLEPPQNVLCEEIEVFETEFPTDEPTVEPTAEPTEEPTEEPTDEPTEDPSDEPSEKSDGIIIYIYIHFRPFEVFQHFRRSWCKALQHFHQTGHMEEENAHCHFQNHTFLHSFTQSGQHEEQSFCACEERK